MVRNFSLSWLSSVTFGNKIGKYFIPDALFWRFTMHVSIWNVLESCSTQICLPSFNPVFLNLIWSNFFHLIYMSIIIRLYCNYWLYNSFLQLGHKFLWLSKGILFMFSLLVLRTINTSCTLKVCKCLVGWWLVGWLTE